MLTPAEAQRIIADTLAETSTERVAAPASRGRVLREPITAERDQPPFDRVTMDGIAIAFRALDTGQRDFPIDFTQHAGDPTQTLARADACAEVMTGSVLPPGADTVVPVEQLTIAQGAATIDAAYDVRPKQFVHRRASDHTQGTELLRPGAVITPADIAIIASCGREQVEVARSPTVRIVSTGNELIPAGAPIEAHQVRLSNGPALVAMLAEQGFADARSDHLRDDPAALETSLGNHLETSDVLILSGGVSMGKADFVPDVLAALGVEKRFHRVRQRPGKPLWFGRGSRGQAVFALPGNPVSAIVCCRHYVLPALFAAAGRSTPELRYAVLEHEVEFKPQLTCFMPVKLRAAADGRRVALPVTTNTSGDFTALSGTDGYVELTEAQSVFAAGLPVPYHAWDTP